MNNKITLNISRTSGRTSKLTTTAKYQPSELGMQLAEALLEVLTHGDATLNGTGFCRSTAVDDPRPTEPAERGARWLSDPDF